MLGTFAAETRTSPCWLFTDYDQIERSRPSLRKRINESSNVVGETIRTRSVAAVRGNVADECDLSFVLAQRDIVALGVFHSEVIHGLGYMDNKEMRVST